MNQPNKIKVGILGVSGYGGGELARLLLQHPQVELSYVTSKSYAGKKLSDSFAGLKKRTGLVCEVFDPKKACAVCDVIFLAGEAGLAMTIAPVLLENGKKLIDLSADFRLTSADDYKLWYKKEHTAKTLLPKAVYGLPELYREKIKTAQLIANPGCYPTSAILALMPLLKAGFIDVESLIIDSYSGTSGAGRSKFGLDYHFAEVNESLRPYGAGGAHRHVPEIEQILGDIAQKHIMLSFTPHLAPITRGIMTTAYAKLNEAYKNISSDALQGLYEEAYVNEPFVVVLEQGAYPATKSVVGSNACHVSFAIDKRTQRVIAFAAQDNLVKGMAGQAVQNMNLMCGFDETTGLGGGGLWP